MKSPTVSNGSLLLEVQGISKYFSGVRALSNVNLTLKKGELLAVIGENGAGKSTLMKILAGVLSADDGRIFLEGLPAEIYSVSDALGQGVVLIHQELNQVPQLDVAANVLLGRESSNSIFLDQKTMRQKARKYLQMVGLNIEPSASLRSLSVGQQQLVEIAKALATNARILIMDEPTSSLTRQETENLFRVIRQLQETKVGVLYISHRLGEVEALADRVEILRDGKNVGSLAPHQITRERMVQLMVGRDLSPFYHQLERKGGEPALEVTDLCTASHPQHKLNFQIKRGEMVGVAGLVGAGRTDLVQTLFGIASPLSGTVKVAGQTFEPRSPVEAILSGIALVPKDRKSQGLILDMAVRVNLSLASLRRDQNNGFLNRKKEARLALDMTQQLGIKLVGLEQPVRYLSGGNQQKVVLARWLAMRPEVLILDEPTRGVDVKSKDEIYRILEQLAADGMAIIFVSNEMEELLRLADRVVVMYHGAIEGELMGESLNERAVMHCATGGFSIEVPGEEMGNVTGPQ